MALGSQDGWLRPERMPEELRGSTPAARTASAMFELRPLSLGELLDRTFALYRSQFWLFAGIAAVSACVQVLVQAISLTTQHALMRNIALAGPKNAGSLSPFALHGMLSAQIGTWVAGLLFFLVSAVTQAATSLAMSEVYLGKEAHAKQALLAVLKRWYRWIGIACWQAGSLMWIFLVAMVPALVLLAYGTRSGKTVFSALGGVLLFAAVFGGFPAGFVLYLRNALAVPAAVVERLGVRAAMRRSKGLAAGTKGRIFVLLLISGCLYLVVGVLEAPASLLILFAPKQEHHLAQLFALLISFVGHTAVAPVALIGLTLLYFDQRVRKEALDLQLLLEGSRGGSVRDAAVDEAPPAERWASLG